MKIIKKFFKLESVGGIILFATAIAAMILDNTAASPYYNNFFNTLFSIQAGPYKLEKPLFLWISDGLMVVYFLLVGLEIKREIFTGELQNPAKVILPAICALCGLLAPAAIYAAINWQNPFAIHGWAIPVATDIAFSLGILSLLGKRVPVSLKIFLTALAIMDDIGAIFIIAVFYGTDLSYSAMFYALIAILGIFILNRLKIKNLGMYCLAGVVLWLCIINSGVHATVAGILLAFLIPINADPNKSPLHKLEHILHPWATFLVLPIFALANAGVSLSGLTWDITLNTVTIGIFLGLFIGKQFGIFSSFWLMVKMGFVSLPPHVTWCKVYGIALICGVGFTMSLFIGNLAFLSDTASSEYARMVRVGVISGSLLSGLLGYIVLRSCTRHHQHSQNIESSSKNT